MEMLGTRYSQLIEKHSEELAEGLVRKLQASERTEAYRAIPKDELKRALSDIYEHLGDWLNNKTEHELQERYSRVGERRAGQGVPLAQVVWALIVSKEHLWTFLEREAFADTAVQLVSELNFILTLEQFFDRAIYFTTAAYTGVKKEQAA
jgi:RsbT co-antagonist protein rsbRD N-terminal domain